MNSANLALAATDAICGAIVLSLMSMPLADLAFRPLEPRMFERARRDSRFRLVDLFAALLQLQLALGLGTLIAHPPWAPVGVGQLPERDAMSWTLMLVVPMLLWWRRGVRRISHVEQSRPRFVFLAFWTPLGYLAGLTGFVGPLFFVIGVAAVVNDGVDPASFQVLALASMLIAVAVAVLWLCRWQSQRVLDKWPPPQVAVPHTKRAAAR